MPLHAVTSHLVVLRARLAALLALTCAAMSRAPGGDPAATALTTITRPWYALVRHWYRGGRPGRTARLQNALAAWQYAHGVLTFGGRGVTLEVRGRTTGRAVRLPLVLVREGGERYLVSMLGDDTQWVRNVRADGGRAVLHAPRPEPVRLVELPVAERPPLLRRYLQLAPGGRPHVPVDRRAPLEAFAAIAGRYPVFRVEPR